MHPHVHCSSIYNSQDKETTQMSINRWVDKEDVVYIHNGVLFGYKREWNNAICSNMDGTRGSHPEWNKRKTNAIWYHSHLVSNIQHKWTFPQKRNSWTWRIVLWLPGGRGREWEGLGVWGDLMLEFKLLLLEWINNEILLCSTENYV